MSYASENDGRFERRAIAAFLIGEFAAAAFCFGVPFYIALTNKAGMNAITVPTCQTEKILDVNGSKKSGFAFPVLDP